MEIEEAIATVEDQTSLLRLDLSVVIRNATGSLGKSSRRRTCDMCLESVVRRSTRIAEQFQVSCFVVYSLERAFSMGRDGWHRSHSEVWRIMRTQSDFQCLGQAVSR